MEKGKVDKKLKKKVDRIEKAIREVEKIKEELKKRGINIESKGNLSDDALYLESRIADARNLLLTILLPFLLVILGTLIGFGIAILAAIP